MFRSVEALLRPRSIVILGASETGGGGWAKAVYENLAYGGFPATTYLVNPKRESLWGEKVYRNFAALPAPVDLAVTIIPAPQIPDVLAEGTAHGLKCALIFAARFGEGGDAEGLARARAVQALCATQGLRVWGPNCMGAVAVREKLLLYPAARVRALYPGSVGVVFQSGGTFQFWLQQAAAARGLGFSYAISSGNELDLDLADYVNFLVEDESTRLIVCMVEGVRRPDAFLAVAAKALAARKPILVLKLGRTAAGRAAAQTHTGALAGDDQVFDAMCRKFGIQRCHSLDDMIETALVFNQGRLPAGSRIAMAIPSGGARGLLLDYAAEEGVEFARLTPETETQLQALIDPGQAPDNPLDTGAGLALLPDKFSAVCRLMCADPHVDVMAMHGMLPMQPDEKPDPATYSRVLAAADKPVVAFARLAQNVTEAGRAFQAEAGTPFLHGMPATLRALKSLVRYAAVLRQGAPALPSPSARAAPLDDDALEFLLPAYGLAPPRSLRARNPEEAARRGGELGFPVALKLLSPQAIHKTEIGGVALDLTDGAAVRQAAEAMIGRLHDHDPAARVDGFLLQEMVSGLELILGVREDAQYGPFLLLGLGGVLVEAVQDFALRLLPVDEAMAQEMLQSLRGRALLSAFRGRPPRDTAAATRAIAGLSRLFLEERHWLAEIEINPLMLRAAGDGACAADVRAVRRGAAS